jgi:hypothetical protein
MIRILYMTEELISRGEQLVAVCAFKLVPKLEGHSVGENLALGVSYP